MANLFKTVYDAIFNGKQQDDVNDSIKRDQAIGEDRVDFIGHSLSDVSSSENVIHDLCENEKSKELDSNLFQKLQSIMDFANGSQERAMLESFVNELPVDMPLDIIKELVGKYAQIVVSGIDHAYRDSFDLSQAKYWQDFIPTLSDKALNYPGLSGLINGPGQKFDDLILKEINLRSMPFADSKGNDLNEYEINLLNKIQKSGMYVGSDVTDDNRRLVDQLFENDYKNLMSAYEKDDFGLIAEIQGTLRLKAGEFLESKGLLPLGTTEAELSSEGYKVELLRSDNNIDHKREAEQDKEFCNAVSKGDYALILDLHSKNYVPSEEVMNSLRNEGVSGNTLVAVEQIMGLNEPGKSLNDLQLEKNHDHGEGKSIGNTVDELFNNL